MDTIRIALGCTPICITSKAISTMPIIGIDRRAANQQRTNYLPNGMRLSRRCWGTAARSRSFGTGQAGRLDHLAPAYQFAVDKALQSLRRRARLRRQTEEYQAVANV